jgi:3-deoxy-D-manno-octulosonic-acid transferase
MILLTYQLLFPLIGLAILVGVFFQGRGRTLKEGFSDLAERLGGPPLEAKQSVIWFHAASVGEVTAAQPLIERIAARHEQDVLVTTSTVAGRERAKKIRGITRAQLAPIDFYPAVARFLARTRPESLVLIETELWPMTLTLAARRGLRIAIANGRITGRSFSRYRLISALMRDIFTQISLVAAQTEEIAQRFRSLGAPNVSVCGNMKYDYPPSPAAPEAAARLAAYEFALATTWTAGSTRRGEEELIIAAQQSLTKKVPGARLILAPRHPERADEVARLLEQAHIPFSRWSQAPSPTAQVLLVDAMGVLPALYAAGSAAFVGGTLVPIGGHNLLEPAQLGKPVLFGPHTGNTPGPAQALAATGGFQVQDVSALADQLGTLLGDPLIARSEGQKALSTAGVFTGATQRTAEALADVLHPKKAP